MSPAPQIHEPVQAVSTLSQTLHDLRQPLSTIEACVFCLRSMLPSDPEIEDFLSRIEQQVFEASRILTDCRPLADQAAERTKSTNAAVT